MIKRKMEDGQAYVQVGEKTVLSAIVAMGRVGAVIS